MKSRFAEIWDREWGKTKAFLRAKGLYVVLMVSALAVGVSAALSFSPRPEDAPAKTPPLESAAPVSESRDERLGALLTPAPTPALTASPTSLPELTPTPAQTPQKTGDTKAIAPVTGRIIWDYSMDSLIYSRTLDQWTTHPGVDIKCPKGEEVYAVWGGTVESVYEDGALGVTVTVNHGDGLVSIYANLAQNPPVQEGARLSARDSVGRIGDTAASECGDESHLHFELWRDGKSLDPNDYLLFES